MIEPILEFLIDNNAANKGHSGRSLMKHLVGTADLLAKWNCEMDVVLAGLCHSIYGTDSYHTVIIDPSRRDEVRALIGEKAEQLAWEFGNRKNPRIVSFIRNNEIDLISIECANLIEQQVDPCFLAVATIVQLPDGVSKAVNDYLRTH